MSPPVAPGRLPLIGHFATWVRDPFAFLTRARRAGDVVEIEFPGFRAILLHDPALIEQVLVTDAKHYSKDRFALELKRVLGEGLLTSEGEFWLRQRRLAQPAFHKERIAGYASTMVSTTRDELARFVDGETRDIHADLMRLTLDIVGKTLFGADVTGRAEEIGVALEAVMNRFADPVAVAVPHYDKLPTALNRNFREAVQNLDRMMRGLVRSHREGKTGDGKDLLSMLLAARDEEGHGMDETQLRDETITLLLAGHETTAIALSWAFVLLARHPDVRARLEAELDRVLGDRDPELRDLPELPFADAVIREAMRLYPPAWSIGREALMDTSIGGFAVPKGSQVWIAQWTVHRDPRWFSRPDVFNPARWLDGLQKRIPKYAYFPFGGGPRLCIGHSFATMEAVLVLATIARRFRVELAPDANLAWMPAITLRPKHGVRARLLARQGSVRRSTGANSGELSS